MTNLYTVKGDFLQQDAYANVWCTPGQDRQTIIKPARLTPVNGSLASVRVTWRNITLPDTKTRFHVYQIGEVHPSLLGLSDSQGVWINTAQACTDQNLIADTYTAKGYQIPRFDTWYMVTPEENLIMALRVQDATQVPIDLNTEDIFLRLYKNAYFNSGRSSSVDGIYVQGMQVQTNADILNVQNVLNEYRAKPGACYCWVNGMVVDNIDLVTAKPYDSVEFVYDSSIKQVLRLPISGLKDFVSTKDGVHKYLVHNSADVQTIDYHDDLDFFLVKRNTLNASRFNGLYYHRNSPMAVRMVTHKDYAIPVPFVAAYLPNVPGWNSVDDMDLIVQIRKAGYVRPLIFEANRIKDLYRMSDTDALGAMIGINATVNVWKAESLENSPYCALMAANLGQITRQNVQDAYGYNAVSKLVGDTPLQTVVNSNQREVMIPPAMQTGCTVYEYDGDGLLIGWYLHANTVIYPVQNPQTRLVEVIGGNAGEVLDIHRDQTSVTLDLNANYRFYTTPIVAGVPTNVWTDVSNTSNYTVAGGVATWSVNPANFKTIALSNKRHLTYAYDYLMVDGIISFTLREFRLDIQDYRTLAFFLGELDIFLNGHSLVRGLDYYVNFPTVVITNKEYLKNPATQTQRVVIRHVGFCKSDMTLDDPSDVGFVEYGVLSHNHRYDIRDDKVNRIIVDGQLYAPNELSYGEDDFTVALTDARNGAPYAIRDIVVPLNAYLATGSGTYVDPTFDMRAKAKLVDKAISDYLTLKLPEKAPVTPSAIPGLYKVYSPFFSRIIYDLKNGLLTDPRFVQHYDDQFVKDKCQPYEQWLAYDPLLQVNAVNHDYVIIQPHPYANYVTLGIYQYRFLNRVVAVYGGNLIDLSSFVNIDPNN